MGRILATISAKGRVVLWDAKTGEEVKTLPALDKRITALTFTSDAATLLVGGTGPIHRVSLPEGKKVGELEGHKVVVACLRLLQMASFWHRREETASFGCGPPKTGRKSGKWRCGPVASFKWPSHPRGMSSRWVPTI